MENQVAIVVGAGSAGLTAAMYLGRFRDPAWCLKMVIPGRDGYPR
jgi:thioredoxin reductase